MPEKKTNLLDLTKEELEEKILAMGHPKYRARQIFRWLGKGASSIDEMTDISKDLREELKKVFVIDSPEIAGKLVSKIDGTVKYLFRLSDGYVIESVLMGYKHGFSACISSQVGCKMGCKFCASTGIGFDRNLTAGEFLAQIIAINRDIGERVSNIVVMGIGEPFDNYDNLVKFLRIAHDPDGLNMGYRRITVSTSGLVPGIIKLSQEDMPVNLSISLHAPNDTVRAGIMPVNKRYSIDKLIEACNIYTRVTKRRITFEYIMISGLNDSEENARELAEKIKGMLCHVNLIPLNDVSNTGFKRSSRNNIEKFRNILMAKGIETTVRRELGEDINAACGQLRKSAIEAQKC